MATTVWSAFLDHVMPDVPGCPQAIALDAIQIAAREFYEKAKIYRWAHPLLSIVATQAEYPFTPPTGYVVWEIIQDSCWINGRKIYPRAPLSLNQMYQDWLTATAVTSTYFTQVSERSVRLVPIPSASIETSLKFWVWLKPSLQATGMDTDHFEEYFRGIAHKAKALLMEQPTKPYSNARLSMYNEAKYEEECGRAWDRCNRGATDDRGMFISFGS